MFAPTRIPCRCCIVLLVATLFLLAGCSDDNPTDVLDQTPEAEVAASLAAPSQTAGLVTENLTQVELFQNPLSSLAEDVGLYQDTDLEGWTGEGMDFPAKSAVLAESFRTWKTGNAAPAALLATDQTRQVFTAAVDKAAADVGDTLAVFYYDAPDSSGLDAVVAAEGLNMVRFVSVRAYPAVLGRAVRRDQEILLDDRGTTNDDTDDQIHRAEFYVEMTGGEMTVGTLAPVSGTGPILPEVPVRAYSRVDNPRWRLLQEWASTEMILDAGDIRVEGDEIITSIEAVVHWRTDAEYTATVSVPEGGPIGPQSIVLAVGELTAAPANSWLESVTDELRVILGDFEDETDDLLIEANRRSVFDGTARDGGSPRHSVHFLPDEPVAPGEEPCGGLAEQDIWYPATWWIVHLEREADIECDGSGTLHVLQELRDGSTFERTVTWDGLGVATVDEERLDGTVISGSFDENTGEYSVQTVFAAGHDPVSRDQHGTILEGSVEAWDIFTWQDEHVDTTYFTAEGGDSDLTVSGYKIRGEVREDFTLEMVEGESLAGQWTRNDGATGDFTLEPVEGGGAHLVYSASDPAAEGSPSVQGDIWIAPDGSGTGTITFTQYGTTVVFEITFGPGGEGFLTGADGQTVTL